MSSFVLFQVVLLTKSFSAWLTLMKQFPSMCQQMSLKYKFISFLFRPIQSLYPFILKLRIQPGFKVINLLHQNYKMAIRWRYFTLRCCFCEKPLWQWSQTKGRSPVWILLCDCKFVVSANRAPHRSQTKGRSPVCVRSCLVFCPFNRNLNWSVNHVMALESFYRFVQKVHW